MTDELTVARQILHEYEQDTKGEAALVWRIEAALRAARREERAACAGLVRYEKGERHMNPQAALEAAATAIEARED